MASSPIPRTEDQKSGCRPRRPLRDDTLAAFERKLLCGRQGESPGCLNQTPGTVNAYRGSGLWNAIDRCNYAGVDAHPPTNHVDLERMSSVSKKKKPAMPDAEPKSQQPPKHTLAAPRDKAWKIRSLMYPLRARDRLPSESKFEATFDADANKWTGTLTVKIDAKTVLFRARCGGITMLIYGLDEMYRIHLFSIGKLKQDEFGPNAAARINEVGKKIEEATIITE